MSRRIFRRVAFTTVLLTSLLPLDVLAKADFPETDQEILELFNYKESLKHLNYKEVQELYDLQKLDDQIVQARLKKARLNLDRIKQDILEQELLKQILLNLEILNLEILKLPN